MKYFHHAALWRLVVSACLKLPFYGIAGTVNFTAECACLSVALLLVSAKLKKQNQSGILAQKILLCGKLPREFFLQCIIHHLIPSPVKYRTDNCRKEGADVS